MNLESFAYLWDADQSSLLHSMINDGMDSVLVKTCAYGLDKNDLLKSIKELQPKLEKLKKETQLNVCGEGGEYETITLDSPLYIKKIKILETDKIIHSVDIFTEVSYVIIKKYEIIDKICN